LLKLKEAKKKYSPTQKTPPPGGGQEKRCGSLRKTKKTPVKNIEGSPCNAIGQEKPPVGP